MNNQIESLNGLVEDFNTNFEKFEKGNDAAGARARKALLHIHKFAKETRDYIQAKRVANKQL